ncbi:MAG: hypothetical protein A2Z34_09375 [Planctomycetes bacterium RBG_16_59_8]|nr:MAG: hypothetical protein A2Z34_09375 [Planctomycetes bacterium RBG_16_59_8]
MRQPVTAERVRLFMRELGSAASPPARVYLVGGATATLLGWRSTTMDVDIKIVPENDSLLKAIPRLKESLQINVEFASPDLFIPPLPGWEKRSPPVEIVGNLSFHHYDFYAQALAKIERGHQQDIQDIDALFRRGNVLPAELLRFYNAIEPELYRYPAVDEAAFRNAVEETVRRYSSLESGGDHAGTA